jgi:hypothetical protein
LLAIAQFAAIANASQFFADDVEIGMSASVNQSCARSITRRLQCCAITSGTRWIKQDASEFLGGSKLPYPSWTVEDPGVVHVSTGKRTPKRTKRARLPKNVV